MPFMSSEMGTPQRARMYPSAEEIHGTEEMEAAECGSGDDDRVYVAVGKDVKESKHNLMWVVKNFHGKRICIIHVLQPSQLIPFMGGKFHPSALKEHVVNDHRDRERQSMQEVLKTYLSMLQQAGARGEAVHIEKGSVEEGIVELISLQRIKRLVIGAAANKHYHKKMVDIRSKTAKYVHEHGHSSCHIWFICKGHLIKRREAAGASDDSGMPRRLSDCMSVSDVSPVDGTQYADSPQCSITMRDASDWNGMFRPSSSQSSSVSVPTVGYEDHGREAGNHEDVNNKIYFAVGSNIGGSWPNLSWVERNFPGQKICFLHILQPTKMIPSKHAPQGGEKKRIQDILKNYHPRLSDTGGVEEVYLKMQKVEEGIVTLISHLKIKNLVMGAAAGDKFYLRSKITKYVSVNGSESCQIWFLHEGHLIKTRYEQVITAISSKKETHEESLRREKAEKESIEAVRKAKMAEKLQCKEMQLTRETKDATIRYASNWSEIFSSSSSQTSVSKVSSFSATYAPSAPPIVDFCHGNGSEEILMQAIAQLKEIISNPWPHNLQEERTAIHEMYEELEQAMAEAESKREDFEESSRRRKAARDAVDASRQAKAAEIKMDSQLLAVMAERDSALREKSLLQDEIADFKKDKNKLTEKIAISVELLQRYQNERDEFKAERDRALIAAELRRHLAECLTSSGSLPQLLFEFSYSEIEDATQFFDPSFKFDERGHWRIYRGVLRHIEVAVKLLDADSSIGPSEYRQEVDALSRLRHPNIVTLIGACPEALAIIYEHFPNGSLEDRLNCQNNSSPLPWQTRICIAVEICSVLIFLHSSKSHCLVHGDLRPSNILLDGNFTSKLGHFGCSRVMTTTTAESTPKSDVKGLGEFFTRIATQRAADGGFSQSSSTTPSTSRRTSPRPQVKLPDAFVYMDYEYVITGEYTPELDVYSFGMILLRLLTGKEVRDIRNEVQFALDEGNLNSLLDCSVGDWPYVQAQQLARIALRCTDVSRKNRPDLESEVLGVLQKMKASCQGSRIGSQLGGDLVYSQVPPYYICPINQDVMQDPHVAADGFTYEYDAIQGWLLSSHDTSPMTNLKLDHKKLVPNRALRSAIQEWRHNL